MVAVHDRWLLYVSVRATKNPLAYRHRRWKANAMWRSPSDKQQIRARYSGHDPPMVPPDRRRVKGCWPVGVLAGCQRAAITGYVGPVRRLLRFVIVLTGLGGLALLARSSLLQRTGPASFDTWPPVPKKGDRT